MRNEHIENGTMHSSDRAIRRQTENVSRIDFVPPFTNVEMRVQVHIAVSTRSRSWNVLHEKLKSK